MRKKKKFKNSKKRFKKLKKKLSKEPIKKEKLQAKRENRKKGPIRRKFPQKNYYLKEYLNL